MEQDLDRSALEKCMVAAAARGDLEAVQNCIDSGVSVDCTPEEFGFTTPLINAAMSGYDEICKLLLSNGADINYVRTVPEDVVLNRLSREESIALMVAAHKGHLGTYVVPIRCSREGFTALMAAAQEDHLSTCKLLLAHGADVSQVNSSGAGALEIANKNPLMHREGLSEVSRLLVEKMIHHVSESQRRRIDAFSLCLMRIGGREYANLRNAFRPHMKWLIQQENTPRMCERVNSLQDPGRCYLLETFFNEGKMLSKAVHDNDFQQVRYLIAAGVAPDSYVSLDGFTPLMASMTSKRKKICRFLLDIGADVFYQTQSTRFPLKIGGLQWMTISTNPLGCAYMYGLLNKDDYEIMEWVFEKMFARSPDRALAYLTSDADNQMNARLMQKYFANQGRAIQDESN